MRAILSALLLATVLQAAAQLTPIDPRNLDARVTALTTRVDSVEGWGDHVGLYRSILWVPDWEEILSKPDTATRWPAWEEVTGKPATFAPSAHTHPIAEVTGLQAALDTKWVYDEATIQGVKVDAATDADTVGGLTVETAVPIGAVFTDTVYTDGDVDARIAAASVGDLSDVSAATPTARDALLWDGVDSWEARALAEDDISDLQAYELVTNLGTAAYSDSTAFATAAQGLLADAAVGTNHTGNVEVTGDLTASNLNIANWDTAFGWGDHGTEGYLTEETDPRLPAHGTTGNLLQDDGTAWISWTPDYITDYTVTEGDVTNHQAAITITESQISDLVHYTSTDWATDFAAEDTDGLSEGTTHLYHTDARAVDAIKADEAWNATNWDTAFGWGDHETEGYLTDYTVTESDVTAHEGALTITESQISDLAHYTSTDFGTDFAAKSTTDLSEGTNLYFTDARAVTAFEGVSFRFVVSDDGADFEAAITNAVAGTTIVVPAGTYALTANLTHDTAADIVVPGAAGGARAVLTGAYSFTIAASCTIEGLDVTGLTPANFQFTFTDNATPVGTLRYCDAGDYSFGYWQGKTNNFDVVGSTFGHAFCDYGGTNNGAITNSTFGDYFCVEGTNNGAITNSTFGTLFCAEGGTNTGTITGSTFGVNVFGVLDVGYGTNDATIRDSKLAETASYLIDRLGTDGEYIDCIDSNGVLFSTPDVLYGNVLAGEVDATVLKQDGTTLDTLLGGKADIVETPTDGNFAVLNASGNLADSGSTAADFYEKAETVDPVFLIDNQPGASWTDFELKGSTNNFAGMHYWYHSPDPTKTVVTNQVWDVRPAVYFTDSRATNPRVWIQQNNEDAIYDMLVDTINSYVGGWVIYVRGLGMTRAELEDWVWSYMLMDGANKEDDTGGKSIWRVTSPVRYVPANTEPNL